MALEDLFPRLKSSPYTITSPSTLDYNCLAWAAGRQDVWWEPDPDGDCYWPDNVPRERTLSALIQAYETIGYNPCNDEVLEPGFEKIALYAIGVQPTHAARQLPNGFWTSKIGACEDIEHALASLTGAEYGAVVQFLKRRM